MIQSPDLYVVCERKVTVISTEVVFVAVQSISCGEVTPSFSSAAWVMLGVVCVTDLPVETLRWILDKPNCLLVGILVLSELKCVTGNMLLGQFRQRAAPAVLWLEVELVFPPCCT